MSEQNQQEDKIPTKEEIISFLKEQIEVKSAQLELQRINTELATLKVEEVKAYAFMGQMQNPSPDSLQDHVLSKEDIENNPELAEEGLKEGDTVQIPVERKLKKV